MQSGSIPPLVSTFFINVTLRLVEGRYVIELYSTSITRLEADIANAGSVLCLDFIDAIRWDRERPPFVREGNTFTNVFRLMEIGELFSYTMHATTGYGGIHSGRIE